MKTIKLETIERTYKNNGQHAEQVARYTLTGKIEKADNLPFWAGGDVGTLQIKSSRATVCKGLNVNAHIDADAATMYGYVTADFSTLYIMNIDEYLEFVTYFGTVTNESPKNGGSVKVRLKTEGNMMREWLRRKA